MRELDLSRLPVPGGFFVLRSQRPRPFAWGNAPRAAWTFLGTYRDSGTPLRDALVALIDSAEHRVFVVSFLLGDDAIIDALLRAAERLKGGVYVITALDESSIRRGLRDADEDDSSPPEERQKRFERLTQRGIYVRGHSDCHAKLAVVDSRSAVIGSANFVKNAFEWTNEACVQVSERSVVDDVIRLFADLWHRGCEWEIPPGVTYSVAERQPAEAPVAPPNAGRSVNDLVWTDGSRARSLLTAMHSVIDSANVAIVLSSYSIVGMRDHPELLLEPIANARSRGVAVRLLVRQRNAYPDQMEDLLALHDLGVEVFADTRNHAKVVVADQRDAVIFSANLDAMHGLTSGVEAGVRVAHPEVVQDVCRYIDHAIAEADTAFLRDPLQGEIDGRLAARWCKEWQYGDVLEVGVSKQEWRKFRDEASDGPVLFEAVDENRFKLYAGNVTMWLSSDGGEMSWYDVSVVESDQSSKERLAEWLQSVRKANAANTSRGFCPARLHLRG